MVRLLSVANAALGLWLAAAPLVLGYGGVPAINDVVLGLTVLAVALFSLVLLPRFTDSSWLTVVCGLWITLSPALLGYEQLQRVATNDVVIGLLVTVLAAVRVCARPAARA